jgi:hypothetical protein
MPKFLVFGMAANGPKTQVLNHSRNGEIQAKKTGGKPEFSACFGP